MEAAREQDVLRPGARLAGRYRIDGLIGRGGMGEVYAASNRRTGRRVALKVLRTVHASEETGRRLLREAQASNAIRHPNVIDVFDVFESNGSPVLVMELLEGETLSALMRRERLDLEQVAVIMLPVADALKAAHAMGIVHRDLKPDNIFLTRAGGEVKPKLLDFGIAKVLDPAALLAESYESETRTGTVLGTPHYMSFEQAMSEVEIDHRADVWSFGVIMFELLAGRRPLEFDSLGQMYAQLLQSEVPPLDRFVADVPPNVCELVDRSLVKNREQRLSSMDAWVTALRDHARGRVDVHAQTVAPVAPLPMRRRLLAGALVIAAGGVGLAAVRVRSESATHAPVAPNTPAARVGEAHIPTAAPSQLPVDSAAPFPKAPPIVNAPKPPPKPATSTSAAPPAEPSSSAALQPRRRILDDPYRDPP